MADVKAAIKEGGKKGVDIAGMSAMGGVMFFHVSLDTEREFAVKENIDLLKKVLEGANAEVDEAAEERKGGAGDLAKAFLSAGDKKLLILVHVPDGLSNRLSLKEWTETLCGACKGKVVEETGEVAIIEASGAEGEFFPIKVRDEVNSAGFALLKAKGLIPEVDSDDDVNYAEAAGVEW
mmetsp:Transcript_29689/g.65703  ORF Transcript_29689/g.65703 Transcript_29689/m.65703 type:complete len:179 (+) Transcript_29689:116-652(+)|eukprot:CAMPEP_0202895016 /NCGR_PEP_ID=MMETSP1392-20130828/4289_1 /ASSEMBLY_ACC=CAM_ASM_000868 /TAXON_ID=225041 /ORGANISM="Chlamydomonas chlamydogama, Strain SAG 11-48b" /LENGTH=178 /DNA_ID=CAMNT_0049579885 /DNA_START=119 /DNA_END=655 /DNA_ORIENTATION=+